MHRKPHLCAKSPLGSSQHAAAETRTGGKSCPKLPAGTGFMPQIDMEWLKMIRFWKGGAGARLQAVWMREWRRADGRGAAQVAPSRSRFAGRTCRDQKEYGSSGGGSSGQRVPQRSGGAAGARLQAGQLAPQYGGMPMRNGGAAGGNRAPRRCAAHGAQPDGSDAARRAPPQRAAPRVFRRAGLGG